MRQTKAFTRIELLVVIAIIALLVSILAPSLTEIMGGANEAKCLTNLDALRKTMAGYAGERGGQYPFSTHNPKNTGPTHASDGMAWFAREMGVQGKMFVCPATDDNDLSTDLETTSSNNRGYSYGYQASMKPPAGSSGANTVGVTDNTKNAVIFLGDNPSENAAGKSWGTELEEGETIEELEEGSSQRRELMGLMSPNHRDGVVAMVASKSGVMKAGRADVGYINDDIYTTGGAQGPKRNGGSTAGNTIVDRQDSYLIRSDDQGGD